MNDFEQILGDFEAVSLKQIDSVKLMNRMDSKFLFSRSKLNDVFSKLSMDYYILQIKNKKVSAYKTLYYDSEDFICYYMHQFGRANRYKFRTREYLETGKSFFEMKLKNNHKKTYKSRISRNDNDFNLGDEQIEFVTKKLGKSIHEFNGVVWVYYKRISLVSKSYKERLTIDIDLRFENESDSKSYDNIVILELKQDKNLKSDASEVLQSQKIFQESLSKYCLGIASLYPVKKNNIKEKIRLINRISYESA